jgi:hypothetical protein
MTPDSERLASAAFRLKHDLGKAVRWNAPARRERNPEALRLRLAKDLLETRVGPDGRARGAVEIFDSWMSEEGALFRSAPDAFARLTRMSEAIAGIRRRLPRLSELGWNDLVALDEAALLLFEETRALWREALSSASTSTAR